MKELVTALVLGTATPGGGFPVYGDAFAAMVNAQEPLPLRVIAAMYSSPGLVMVRGDSPYRSLAELAGKPVVMGTQASGVTALGRTVFQSLDIVVTPIFLEKAADGPPMLLDRRAEALWGAGVGWPAFTALAKGGARFLGPNPQQVKAILAKNPALMAVTLPAKSYPGQDAPLHSVGSWSYVLSHSNLNEETAWRLARAVHWAEGALAARLEQARETTMANTAAAAPRPDLLHPGVQRYLREAGLGR